MTAPCAECARNDETMSEIHVCWTNYVENKIGHNVCPTCQKTTAQLCRFAEWYGWHITCLECGDSWNDGEMAPRPFMRGWRKAAISEAKKIAAALGLITE